MEAPIHRSGVLTPRGRMTANTGALARRKGFTFKESTSPHQFRLIDNATRLQEINAINGSFLFSLGDAAAFLGLLHDRPIAEH